MARVPAGAREGVRGELGTIPPLDGLRGVALLWVVAFHCMSLRAAAGDAWALGLADLPVAGALIRNGYLGVDLFFLLSGFLLALPWHARAIAHLPAPSTAAFYRRRIRRIVPAYYLQLALLFVLVLPLLHGRDYWRGDLWVYLWNAVAHALFLQDTTPLTSASMGVNGVLWTLAVEAQFYLLLPWIAPAFARVPRRMLAISIAVALAWSWAAANDLRPLVAAEMGLGTHWGWSEATVRELLALELPAFAAHFALGIVLGRAWLMRRDVSPPARRIGRPLAGAAALVALWALVAVLAPRVPWAVRPLATALLAALLYLAATSRSGLTEALLGRGPLVAVGRVSYSAYLYHLPLLVLWGAQETTQPAMLALAAYAIVLGAVSWTSWRFVERPFLEATAAPKVASLSEPESAIAPRP